MANILADFIQEQAGKTQSSHILFLYVTALLGFVVVWLFLIPCFSFLSLSEQNSFLVMVTLVWISLWLLPQSSNLIILNHTIRSDYKDIIFKNGIQTNAYPFFKSIDVVTVVFPHEPNRVWLFTIIRKQTSTPLSLTRPNWLRTACCTSGFLMGFLTR